MKTSNWDIKKRYFEEVGNNEFLEVVELIDVDGSDYITIQEVYIPDGYGGMMKVWKPKAYPRCKRLKDGTRNN